MFQIIKFAHEVVASCSDNEGNYREYSFIEEYDVHWGDIVEAKFKAEFGHAPTEVNRISYKRLD